MIGRERSKTNCVVRGDHCKVRRLSMLKKYLHVLNFNRITITYINRPRSENRFSNVTIVFKILLKTTE